MDGLCFVFLLLFADASWTTAALPAKLITSEGDRKHLPATMGGGMAVFDFDGDGLLDLFFANGGDLPSGLKTKEAHANHLFRNLGGRRFSDVTKEAGVGGTQYSFGAAVGDYDDDGKLDLLVAHIRGVTLYRNLGRGRFQDVTKLVGLQKTSHWSVGAAWFDCDGDQDLDLYITNYVVWDAGAEQQCLTAGRPDFCNPKHYQAVPGALFRNDGGKFTDVSEASEIGKFPGKGMGAAVADFNADGHADLFITNDRLPAFLFMNDGKGRFDEAAFENEVAVPADGKSVSGMGVDSQDYDGDGHPDLIYTALRDETFPLYRGTGQGLADASRSSRLSTLSRPFSGWGVAFGDLDSDGLLDIAAATSDALSGKVDESRKSSVVLFRNAGMGRFEPAQALTPPAMYRGLVAADIDADGCEDIVATALEASPQILFHSCANPGKGLKRQWQGSSAIGYASSLWSVSSSSSR